MALKHSRAKLPRESSREASFGRGRDPGRPLRRPGPGGGTRRGGAAAGEPPPRLSPAARGPALRRGPRPEPPGVAPVAQPARGPPLVPAFPAPARLGSARLGGAPRLHSRHGRLQQVPHRAPFRHRRRHHGRRLRAALPAQQAAGGRAARVSGAGREERRGEGAAPGGRGRSQSRGRSRGRPRPGGPSGQAVGPSCR